MDVLLYYIGLNYIGSDGEGGYDFWVEDSIFLFLLF